MSDDNPMSYGGDSHPDPDTVAAVLERVYHHADAEIDGHTTADVLTYDDGTIVAEVFESRGLVPGTPPGVERHSIKYDSERADEIRYREYIDRAGKPENISNERVLETGILE